MTFHETVLGIAMSQDWLSLGLNFILSIIVGGIVVTALLAIAGRAWGEGVKPANAFIMVMVINVINLFGVLGFLSFLGGLTLVLPLLVWILLTKLFFKELSWLHMLIIGVAGYVLSIFVIPIITGYAIGYTPF